MTSRAVFVDRDGVINQKRAEYVTSLEEFQLLPEALVGLAMLAGSDFKVIVITNQSAVARGLLGQDTLDAIHGRMMASVSAAGGRIDMVYACPHAAADGCACRKPLPGLLLRAAGDFSLDLAASYFVGDAPWDVQAARAAGCQPVLVLTGLGRKTRRELGDRGDADCWIANDLRHAAELILGTVFAGVKVRAEALR